MNVIFRVDASARMGVGHVTRCMTFAGALRERGARVRFICREHPGHLIQQLRDAAMPVTVLPAPTTSGATGENYAEWLGATQLEDAAQTAAALGSEKPDWLVIDHYSLDVTWEQRLRFKAERLMVIDDLANRRHDCDVLLDQNFSLRGDHRYSGLVPENCKVLAGPRFALLRPEYVAHRKLIGSRDGRVGRVLVFFGGSDPCNLTGLVLDALSSAELRHLEVNVVVGVNNPHADRLAEQARARPGTTLHSPRPHLADLMAQADLALGAGGATTWERMCLGLPSLVVSIAENQRPGCEALAASGLIRFLGDSQAVDGSCIRDAIVELSGARAQLIELSIRNRLTVDGLGALRTAECLDPTMAEELRLRPACDEDIGTYFDWANDPEVRRQAIHSQPISWPTHSAWFGGKLSDSQSHLLVMEARQLPAGQIRFDVKNGAAWIDYSIDRSFRGRGWGKWLVAAGMSWMRHQGFHVFRANVKELNSPSMAVFRRAGFEESPQPGSEGLRTFVLDRSVRQLPEMH